MFKLTAAALLACLAVAKAQQVGTLNQGGGNKNFPWKRCTASGCTTETGQVVLDANWRWTHEVGDYQNCYTGNQWDQSLCPDGDTCAANCAIEPLKSEEWQGTYGITVDESQGSVNLKFVTQGPFSTNIGSRLFLLNSGGNEYEMFDLLGKEFTFEVDDSNLECGLNGALYFVEMDRTGNLNEGQNSAGAALGTGYCDAQCPHDVKWMKGKANSEGWEPSDNDANAGAGDMGACCNEMDIWEANNKAQAYTTHPCSVDGMNVCNSDQECGDSDRYGGMCDKDGCDFASYRLGDHNYWGSGSSFTVDASQAVHVVTQFHEANGELAEVTRFYIQNGVEIPNSRVNFDGISDYDRINNDFCREIKELFGDYNDHDELGGLKKMGEALRRGMVLTMSLWDDHSSNMLWLDSVFPPDGDINQPGVLRGPCDPSSGNPPDVEEQYKDATVTFRDVRYGDIGTTYTDLLK